MTVNKIDIAKPEDFSSLRDIWGRLEKGADMTVFQSYDWNLLLVKEFFSNRYNRIFSKLKVYCVLDKEEPVMIVPVIVQKKTVKVSWYGRKKGLYILGIGSYSDYINFIYNKFSETAYKELTEYVKQDNNGITMNINFLRADTALQKYCETKGLQATRVSRSAHIDLPASTEEYQHMLSKNTKQNIRTALNRMNKDGLQYELICCDHLESEADIEKLIRLHRDRLDSKLKKNNASFIHNLSRTIKILKRKRDEHKFDIVENSMKTMPSSHFVIVKLNGETVSYLYGLRDDKAYRIMHNCFDEKYKFYSPMFRGAYDFIVSQCENRSLGVDQIDFTRGDEDYKYKLGAEELLLYHYAV